jgi:PKD repeat protein
MKRYLLILAAAAAFNAQAQNPCGTEIVYKKALEKNPALAETKAKLEKFTQEYSTNAHRSSSTVKIIPVVFHIIHTNGNENISKAQVLDAVRIINEDFRKMNADTTFIVPDFKPIAADCQIEFRLAQLDPNGNCTDGITRTYSPLTHVADDNVKDLISWDNDMYLNIWVVNSISFGAGGYAYYPGSAPPGGEGIVVLHTQLGGTGTSCGSNFCERTLTHEIGHYFNLPHTWGSNNECGNADACFDSDFVNDTPTTAGACQTCNLTQSTCGFLDNVQNYMDYSTCTRMFTQGQAQRMDAALNSTVGGRYFLWQPSNLAATGTNTTTQSVCIPVPDFKSNATGLCAGGTLNFKDISWNGQPVSWSWQFPGGTPSVSTDSMPIIQYNSTGTYDVTLTVSNSAGSATITRTGYVTVESATADFSGTTYTEGFETMTIPDPYWKIVNPDNGTTWQRTTLAAAAGTASAFIDNSSNWQMEADELISPSYNISMVPNPLLTFRLAFASPDTFDKLQVLVSKDCGRTWTQRYMKEGADLITSSSSSGFFVPSASDWRTEMVSIAFMSNEPNVMFKFRYTNASGNNIYIDNINIFTGFVGVDETGSDNGLSIFPNPAEDKAVIRFNLAAAQQTAVRIYNITGQQVFVHNAGELAAGEHEVPVSTEGFAPGVYITELRTAGQVLVRRLVIK